jgi:hypothetical protein
VGTEISPSLLFPLLKVEWELLPDDFRSPKGILHGKSECIFRASKGVRVCFVLKKRLGHLKKRLAKIQIFKSQKSIV